MLRFNSKKNLLKKLSNSEFFTPLGLNKSAKIYRFSGLYRLKYGLKFMLKIFNSTTDKQQPIRVYIDLPKERSVDEGQSVRFVCMAKGEMQVNLM